jgi:hypothetical protein
MPSNSDTEQYYFKQFSVCYTLPGGRMEYSDKPDVRIINDNRTVGIEITNFYIKDGSQLESEQRQKVVREKVIKDAQEIYLTNGGKNVELSFAFNNIEDDEVLARNIAALVKRIDNYPTGAISKVEYEDISELSFVYLNAQEYDNAIWRNHQVHKIPFMSKERLREIICSKEEKANQYSRCTEYWLLIVIDFMNFAQDQEVIEVSDITSNVFNKILVFKTVYNQVYEIQ